MDDRFSYGLIITRLITLDTGIESSSTYNEIINIPAILYQGLCRVTTLTFGRFFISSRNSVKLLLASCSWEIVVIPQRRTLDDDLFS